MEVKELVIDELDIDGSSDDAESGRAALRSCLFVSRQFHECARSRLFRNIELRDIYKQNHLFQNRLILLHQLLTTSINDHDPGIASNIRKLTISVAFETESDDETEHGEEDSSTSRIIAEHFPPILELIRRDAYRLENLVIEDSSGCWCEYDWASLSPGLHLAFRGLLWMRTLRHLELRNFMGVPNNLFDCTHITHLTICNLNSLDKELELEESIRSTASQRIVFCPLVFLDTDQSFPLERIVDISPYHTPDTSQTKLLKKIKTRIYNKLAFAKVVFLLRAAYLVEDLRVDLMNLDELGSNSSPKIDFDLFPLQKLAHLTMSFTEYLNLVDSGPKSCEIAYSILKSRSPSILYLTLEFNFEIPNTAATPDHLVYPRQEHWEPIDSILAGAHYPKLRQLVLRITLCRYGVGSSPNDQAAFELGSRNRLKAALPRLSSSNRLRLYLV